MFFAAAVVFLIPVLIPAHKIPDFIKLCKRTDPNLNECGIATVNEVIKYLGKNSIPSMNLAKLEPVKLENRNIQTDKFTIDLSELLIYGLSNSEVTNISLNMANSDLYQKLVLKDIMIKSKFEAKGTLIDEQFDSKGTLNINLTDAAIGSDWHFVPYQKNAETHFKFDKPVYQMTYGKYNIQFDKLSEDAKVNSRLNEEFNKNSEGFKMSFGEIIQQILWDYCNTVYEEFSFNELFPE